MCARTHIHCRAVYSRADPRERKQYTSGREYTQLIFSHKAHGSLSLILAQSMWSNRVAWSVALYSGTVVALGVSLHKVRTWIGLYIRKVS